MTTPNVETTPETPRVELPYTISLDEPVEIGSETRTEITFRNRLTAGMLGHIPVGGSQKMADFFPIIGKMTGETPVFVERLGYSDLVRCIEVVSGFFSNGTPPTGARSR